MAVTSAVTQLAPGVSATTPVEAAPAASAEFRAYVTSLKISGVLNGESPRALINGRIVNKGEVVDQGLGVVFVGLNDGELVFKDRSGATVGRKPY